MSFYDSCMKGDIIPVIKGNKSFSGVKDNFSEINGQSRPFKPRTGTQIATILAKSVQDDTIVSSASLQNRTPNDIRIGILVGPANVGKAFDVEVPQIFEEPIIIVPSENVEQPKIVKRNIAVLDGTVVGQFLKTEQEIPPVKKD